MRVRHTAGHGMRLLAIVERGFEVRLRISGKGVNVSCTTGVRDADVLSLSDWFHALMNEGSESGSYEERFQLMEQWIASLTDKKDLYKGPGNMRSLRRIVAALPSAALPQRISKPAPVDSPARKTKYEYPEGMTKAQKQAFRAKMRRGR